MAVSAVRPGVGMQLEQRLPLWAREPQHKCVIQVLARAWVHHTAHCRPVQPPPARLDALSTLCHAWGTISTVLRTCVPEGGQR